MTNQQKEKFIYMRAIEGKSIPFISKETGLSVGELNDYDLKLANELLKAKADEYDKLLEKNSVNSINRFQHLLEIYNRLKTEIDKRDFSGLPTDKLYYMMNDVYELIEFLKDNGHDNPIE